MRTFTLDEAQWMLPGLSDLLKRAMESKRTIEAITTELNLVNHRIFLTGGMLPDLPYLAQRRGMRDVAARSAQEALAEIQALGVQVKDLDIGLLDFPCEVNGEIVLLCWKHGEDSITHYHGLQEGFAGRKPITEAIRNASGPAH